jgi:beta-mannosidase
MIFAAVDQARERRLVDMALEANFNMLRVWGGGMYESDTFYDLCDERGILVWQEFIFACSRYPVDDGAFTENVRAEARYNIRRLAGRPSLVVWCGNNEMEWGAWEWGFDKHTRVLPDYAMFHLILPRLMSEEDPTRYYQPSSPFSPGGLHPNRDDVGDQHPWSVGFGDTDFRKYRDMACRFPNEGGILGPTSLPTMLACLPEGQRHIESFAWQVHDNSVSSWSESPIFPDEMSRQWLGRDIRQMSVEEYTFRGGLLQGEGLREYCENFRRRMFDTSSAIFWMYNDCWPAVRSWTLVDYYLRRTPAFWAVRRALAPLHVVLATQGDEVAVYGVNDTPQPTDATVRYGVINLAGGLPIDRQQQVALPANSSTLLAKFPKSQWPQPTRQMAFAMLVRDGRTIAQTKLFLPLLKEMVWPRADVRVSVRDGLATFVCDTFAWGVCLDLDGELPLADNFFDLLPGVPYTMPWPHAQKPQVLQVGNL